MRTEAAEGNALAELLVEALESELEAAVALRRRLHAQPELAHAEYVTSAAVLEALEAPGAKRVGGTGIVARLGPGSGDGVAVRAELDAVPVTERTGVPFSAIGEAMHACGHDVHMAALVALYRAARAVRDELPRPLVALFQPSEEAYPSGARALIDAGALNGVETVIAAHVHPDVPWGEVAAGGGPVNAACDNFEIVVDGRSGHAAYPHASRDPVVALAEIVISLQALVARRIDPTHSAAVTVGMLAAGTAENVIAEQAAAAGTLRALDPADRHKLREGVQAVAENVARAHGCSARVELTEGEPAVVNDVHLAARVRALLPLGGVAPAPPFRSCGADDFGFYGARARLLLLFVGLLGAPDTPHVPLHHSAFLPPDEAVAEVARAQAVAYAAVASA